MQKRKLNGTGLLILFIMLTSSVLAQKKGSLAGSVSDTDTGEEMIGANVYFEGTGIGSISDVNGNFTLPGIPPGEYVMIVSYIGYKSFRETIQIEAGDAIRKEISLKYGGGVNLEDVVITAQAKGQIKAINQQLAADGIVNVVSSDRIQELPDANAAESLGRLPGVSVLRSGGEGSKVVIRGLSPKYNKVMIDGIEVASTGSDDRSTNLSMISSYSLGGIEVIKSNTADLDGDFVGGIVNFKLKTAEEGFHTDIIAQGSYNQLKNNYNNYNLVANISNRFLENRLGIFLQGNLESRIRSANERDVNTSIVGNASITEPNLLWASGLTLANVDRVRKRHGGTLVIDYKLNNGSLAFKNFVSAGNDIVQKYTQYYDVSNRAIDFQTQDRNSDVLTMNNVLSIDQQIGNFRVDAHLAHSFSQSQTPNDLSLNFYQSVGAMPGIPRQDPSLDPDSIIYYNNFDAQQIFANHFNNRDDITKQRQLEASLNLEWAFTVSDQITGKLKVGGKYRHKTKSFDANYNFGDVSSGSAGGQINQRVVAEFPQFAPFVDPASVSQIPFAAYEDPDYSHGEYLNGDYGELGPVADIGLMHEVYDWLSDTSRSHAEPYFYRRDDPDSKKDDYSGFEDLYAGYLMGNFKISSIIDFIPGIRYEQNNTTYTGAHGDDNLTDQYRLKYGAFKDTTTHRQNGFLLPMIQMKIKPLDWLQIHLAYTKTLSRPNYSLLVPKRHIGGENSPIILNRYDLVPEQSSNYDINVSVHQNHIGLLSGGFFAKNISDKIFWTGEKAIGEKYPEYGLDESLKGKKINTQYNDSTIVKIRGIELEWQTQFWYLPGALKGFVLNINYTHVFSEAKYPYSYIEIIPGSGWDPDIIIPHDTSYTDRLLDQPDDILNVSLGYDFRGFSARISMLYNNDIFSGTSIYAEQRAYTGDYLRWDLSLKQDLPLEGLQVFLNMNNITGSMDLIYRRGVAYPVNFQHYGMTFDLGIRWRL